MNSNNTAIARGLFGYRPEAVERVLADRATMLGLAAQRAQAAEAKVAELQAMAAQFAALQAEAASKDATVVRVQAEATQKDEALASLRTATAQRDEAIAALRQNEQHLTSQIAELQDRVQRESSNRDVLAQDLMRELAPIIAAAEESARRMTERAQSESAQRLAEADRVGNDVQANMARLTGWRDQVSAIMEALQTSVGAAQAQIADVPQRISEALQPVVDVMDQVGQGLDALSKTPVPSRVVQAEDPHASQQAPEQPVPAPAREEPAANGESHDYSSTGDEPREREYTSAPEVTAEPQSDWTIPAHWSQDPS